MAGFALGKSVIYNYFFDEASKRGRNYATGARSASKAQSFAQRALHAPYAPSKTV